MWLLTAATLLGAAATCANEESSIEKQPRELVTDLRRQLMQDNSDYSNERPKTPVPLSTNLTRPAHQPASQEPANRARNRTGTIPEPSVSRKDLLYYLDIDKLISYTPDDRRYKTLKVRHQFRRSGRGALLQEEGKEGVALVNLDGGPFPELRLPGARRQYRHDHGEADEGDDEMPPPPADVGLGSVDRDDVTRVDVDHVKPIEGGERR